MELYKYPEKLELDSIGYAIGQADNLSEMLNELDRGQFGPDFQAAKEALQTVRQYLEIELTQYPQSN